MTKNLSLNDKTMIPIVWVVSSIPFVVGGILWLSAINSKADDTSQKIIELKSSYKSEMDDIKGQMGKQNSLLIDMRERIIRIESYQKSGR